MNCPNYEALRMVDIACECHSAIVNKTKHISKKRCSTDETYDVQSAYYEREGLVVCDDSSGKVCVLYKKKDAYEPSEALTDNSPDQSSTYYIPEQKIESCFPNVIRKKDGQCSAALYPYEVIRKFPFDDVCKCNENKIEPKEEIEEDAAEHANEPSGTTHKKRGSDKNKKSSSLKSRVSTDRGSKSSLKKNTKKFTKRFKNLTKDKFSSSITSIDLCNCFPDLNCQCPKTGEYKVLKSDYEEKRERPVKTKYIEKPCMQTFFNRCVKENDGNDIMGSDEKQIVFLDSGATCYYNNTPCCTCIKPDPDPDHPSYLSTKVNVTDLMKQLLTFHFNRSYMSQYYSRVQMDNSDDPCEICTDKIAQAVGCVGACCKCPKPKELKSCNCPESSESESESTTDDDCEKYFYSLKQQKLENEKKRQDFNKDYNWFLEELSKQASEQNKNVTSHTKCDCSKINYKNNYQCYNVMCTNTFNTNGLNVCSQCNLWNQKYEHSQNIQDKTNWNFQNRKITRPDAAAVEETETIETRSDCDADPFRKRNLFKGFFSKIKLDWKKKTSVGSIEHKSN